MTDITKLPRVTLVDLPHLMVETTKHADELFHELPDNPTNTLNRFRLRDWEFFTTKGGPAKANEAISRFHENIKFHVTLLPWDIRHSGASTKKLKESFLDSKDRINVLFTNNVTQPGWWMPMTAWIMTHRMSHTLQSGSSLPDFSLEIGKKILDIVGHWFPFNYQLPKSHNGGHHARYTFSNDHLDAFLSSVLTMNSSRNGTVPTVDILGELMAQHQFGGIRLHGSASWRKNRESLRSQNKLKAYDPAANRIEYSMEPYWSRWDQCVEEVEFMLNEEFGKVFDRIRHVELQF